MNSRTVEVLLALTLVRTLVRPCCDGTASWDWDCRLWFYPSHLLRSLLTTFGTPVDLEVVIGREKATKANERKQVSVGAVLRITDAQKGARNDGAQPRKDFNRCHMHIDEMFLMTCRTMILENRCALNNERNSKRRTRMANKSTFALIGRGHFLDNRSFARVKKLRWLMFRTPCTYRSICKIGKSILFIRRIICIVARTGFALSNSAHPCSFLSSQSASTSTKQRKR